MIVKALTVGSMKQSIIDVYSVWFDASLATFSDEMLSWTDTSVAIAAFLCFSLFPYGWINSIFVKLINLKCTTGPFVTCKQRK